MSARRVIRRGDSLRATECDGHSAHSVVLILGLGNPLRKDDGIGPRVIEELKARGLPEGVAALDAGAGGLDLLRVMEGWDDVVIVDAADVDRGRGQIAPGEFVRFAPSIGSEPSSESGSQSSSEGSVTPTKLARLRESPHAFSLHHAGLAEVLALAQALDRPLPSIIVFGVQPSDVGWGEGLSPGVEASVPLVIDAVLEEVAQRCKSLATKSAGPSMRHRSA